MVPKLFQWLFAISIFASIWISLIFGYVEINLSTTTLEVIKVLPLYLLIAFACYSLAVVGYRVATFNDCVEAAEELKQQIKEAKKDLKNLGFKDFVD